MLYYDVFLVWIKLPNVSLFCGADIEACEEIEVQRLETVYEDACQAYKRWVCMLQYAGTILTIIRFIAVDFLYNLSKKGHSGNLKFDHENATLEMQVKTAGSARGHHTTDAKSLSGGERSFATLSFINAVGESVRSPFRQVTLDIIYCHQTSFDTVLGLLWLRAMDEPDVFMDPVHRRVAINVLLEMARGYKNRQFIFITPLDVSYVLFLPSTFICFCNL